MYFEFSCYLSYIIQRISILFYLKSSKTYSQFHNLRRKDLKLHFELIRIMKYLKESEMFEFEKFI